jgi:predicted Na+-dependent transporter
MKGEYMIVVTFVLCIFGIATGTSFRYYMREMIVSIIVLVITMSYGIGFSFASNQQDINDPSAITSLLYLETFVIPLAAILPITVGVIGIGYFLNNKINIGA